MKTITKLEVQKKNPKRCSVFINDEFAFGINIDALGIYHIKKGNQYTSEQYEELLKELQYEEAKFVALRYLGYSPRSIKEMYTKLESYEYDAMIINKTIELLKSYGYLDDIEYAASFILSKIKQQKNGRHKIAYELVIKGISKEISGPILSKYEEEEYQGALSLYHKKIKGKNIRDPKEKAKITRYLQSRGYPFDIIKSVIEQGLQGLEPSN